MLAIQVSDLNFIELRQWSVITVVLSMLQGQPWPQCHAVAFHGKGPMIHMLHGTFEAA
jgi:hypothetical protein